MDKRLNIIGWEVLFYSIILGLLIGTLDAFIRTVLMIPSCSFDNKVLFMAQFGTVLISVFIYTYFKILVELLKEYKTIKQGDKIWIPIRR